MPMTRPVIPREWDAAEEETEMAHFVVLSIVRVVICIGVLFAAATAPKVRLLGVLSLRLANMSDGPVRTEIPHSEAQPHLA